MMVYVCRSPIFYTVLNLMVNQGIFLLMEHASSPDRLLPFRMVKYILSILDAHWKKEKNQTFPLIYPLILYSGKKAYPFSVDFFDLFGNQKQLAKDVFLNPFHLIDLTQTNDAELEKFLWFGTMALLAKHIHHLDIVQLFHKVLCRLRELEAQGKIEYIKLTLSYLVEAGDITDAKAFVEAIKTGLKRGEETMTLAEIWEKRGFEKGILEGKLEGKLEGELKGKVETALNLLKLGVAQNIIQEATHLSLDQINALREKILH